MKLPREESEWRRIDLARRAQIGRDRSARTRAELLAAARALYAARPFDQVTVDDVVGAAGVAKGTFYVHFDSLAELQSLVADELAREFDELLQPRRLALDDPIERIAAGCGAFVSPGAAQSCLGRAGRAQRRRNAQRRRHGAQAAQRGHRPRRARADGLAAWRRSSPSTLPTASFCTRCCQHRRKRRSPAQASAVVAGILRAIGVAPDKAATVARARRSRASKR